MKHHGFNSKSVEDWSKSLGHEICAEILYAIETCDSFFFKDLARLCEFEKSHSESLKAWLLRIHFPNPDGDQKAFYTAYDLCDMAIKKNSSPIFRRVYFVKCA